MYTIFTDTDCDFTPSDVTEYGIKLISMPYSIDGKTIYPYEDFREFDAHSFYETLRNGVVPTTSAIPKERYLNYFEPEFQNGRDILYLHFSSAMSATFASMKEAVEDLKQRYPERSFYSADTGVRRRQGALGNSGMGRKGKKSLCGVFLCRRSAFLPPQRQSFRSGGNHGHHFGRSSHHLCE